MTVWHVYMDDEHLHVWANSVAVFRDVHYVGYFTLRRLLTLTYSMVQSPSWAADWLAASQEIPRISRNPKVHYRTHKRPPPLRRLLYITSVTYIKKATMKWSFCLKMMLNICALLSLSFLSRRFWFLVHSKSCPIQHCSQRHCHSCCNTLSSNPQSHSAAASFWCSGLLHHVWPFHPTFISKRPLLVWLVHFALQYFSYWLDLF